MTENAGGLSNLTDCHDPLETIAVLAAEGVRRFGDNPRAITTFIEGEIGSMPIEKRTELRLRLALVATPAFYSRPSG
ncbi:hypothetical protein [Aureimonas sp. AU12]|uniref:hypothetical protein n=1 Tax=Aureimonas sp. AU12 TaxID=1638161 RepID=UPI0012E38DC6|nr:hypothetical protein [Aureimonas sp. AU12]